MINNEPYGDLFDDEPVPHVVQGMMEIPNGGKNSLCNSRLMGTVITL